ncbi:hypothetical protein BGP77_14870 [Saccharospirillum sp. MSK14-1]|nr:hypothetical protein BGP77_14870 [Saccharospirillum sp. MSK14-1]
MPAFQLSIIIPCFNTAEYLEDCLLSVARNVPSESRASVELIVINDGSTDNTAERLAELLPRTQLPYQLIEQTNRGLSAARNAGLAIASGRYIGFLDSDDIWLEDMQPLISTIQTFQADVIEFNAKRFTDTEMDTHTVFKLIDSAQSIDAIKKSAFVQSDWMVWARFYQRDILTDLYFVEGITYEDVLFTSQCYLRAQNILTIDTPCVGYRYRPTSITNTNTEKDLVSLHQVISKCLQQYRKMPSDLNFFLLCNALIIYMHIYINMHKSIIGIGYQTLRKLLSKNKEIKHFKLSSRLMISNLPLYLVARTIKWSTLALVTSRIR